MRDTVTVTLQYKMVSDLCSVLLLCDEKVTNVLLLLNLLESTGLSQNLRR